MVIYLDGPLGAGKTTFVRYLAHSLGYQGHVKSPTYGLLEVYEINKIKLLHLDLYRVESAEELEFLALRDLYDANSLMLIEWPERGKGELPTADAQFVFSGDGKGRCITLVAHSEKGGLVNSGVSETYPTSNLDEQRI